MASYEWQVCIKVTFDKAIKTPSPSVAGWSVKSYQPTMSPGGALVETTHTIDRITKSEDEKTLYLWLDLDDRLLYPVGNVTVNFFGSLWGSDMGPVAPFSWPFAPLNIDPIFNPHDPEYIEITDYTLIGTLYAISRESYQSQWERITIVDVTLTKTLTHVDDLPE